MPHPLCRASETRSNRGWATASSPLQNAGRGSAISRRAAPELCSWFCVTKTEGAGKTGCVLHSRLSRGKADVPSPDPMSANDPKGDLSGSARLDETDHSVDAAAG